MDSANILDLISGKGFIMVNKGLAKVVGLNGAAIYGELVTTFLYWKNRGELTEHDGLHWFYCTIDDLEDKTTLKRDAQDKAIKALVKEGLIKVDRFGLPAKRHFHVTDKYIQILIANYIAEKPQTDNANDSEAKNGDEARPDQIAEKPQTRTRENRKQDYGKSAVNNKEFNNKQIIKKDSLTIVNLQENKIIEDLTEFERIFKEICHTFYSVFAPGRWSKKQWETLINQFVAETVENGRYREIPISKMKGYAFKSIESMAHHADSKKNGPSKMDDIIANILLNRYDDLN